MRGLNASLLIAALLLAGCGGKSNNNAGDTSDAPAETVIKTAAFESSIEEWSAPFAGACVVVASSDQAQSGTGALKISDRNESAYGPGVSLTLDDGELYIARLWVHRAATESSGFNLMLKVGDSDYRQINRATVDDNNWTLLRGFFRLSAADASKTLKLYVNSDTNADFYLDSFSLSKAAYAPPASANSAAFVKAQGGGLVKDGKAFRLKGINLIAYNDESDVDGATIRAQTWTGFDRTDMQTIVDLGFNSVRLALDYRHFETDNAPGEWLEEGFLWLNTVIGWAKEAGLVVVLDMHGPQGGGFQGPNNITDFWNDEIYRTRFKNLWVEIARRYKNETTIAAYDLINEPCPHAEADYIALLESTINAIRAVDANHLITVETSFADDVPFHLEGYANLLYDFHFYAPWSAYTDDDTSVYPGAGDLSFIKMREFYDEYAGYYRDRSLPFQISEFGQKRETFADKNGSGWVRDFMGLMAEDNAGYHYFSYKGNEFGLYGQENKFPINSTINSDLATLLEELN